MKRFLCTLLILLLCFGTAACSWMDGNYVSVVPHQMGYDQGEKDPAELSDFVDLRSALVSMIDAGETESVFILDDYSLKEIKKDIHRAVLYLTETYPLGAYSVEDIGYDLGVKGGRSALSVSISYLHPRSEMDQIRTVRGIPGAETSIAGALNKHESSLVLLVMGYEETDFIGWSADYAAEHPGSVMELPKITQQVYPKSGENRIVELSFTYQNSREVLTNMQNQVKPVFSSAALYVSSDADDLTKYSQLYNFLMERFDYKLETSLTPSYSLLCHGVGDSKAFAQVYSAMCRQSGLHCITVPGAQNGEIHYWNIILINDVYYHVDLIASSEYSRLQLMEDSQMDRYVWDYSAYPRGGTSLEEFPIENH